MNLQYKNAFLRAADIDGMNNWRLIHPYTKMGWIRRIALRRAVKVKPSPLK